MQPSIQLLALMLFDATGRDIYDFITHLFVVDRFSGSNNHNLEFINSNFLLPIDYSVYII